MKDIPSHMMKFIKKVTRENIENAEDESYKQEYKKEIISDKNIQKVKKAKETVRKERKMHIPEDLDVDEKNKKMKHREPIMKEKWSHKHQKHIYK
ncbi:MAG: hypothetical protein WCT85_03295 [Parachlamydiales bacterium]|jgi:Tol biopolymer transport system component